jgi:hypothetical protein
LAPNTPDAQRRLKEAFESIGCGTDTRGVVLEPRRKDNGKPISIQWNKCSWKKSAQFLKRKTGICRKK